MTKGTSFGEIKSLVLSSILQLDTFEQPLLLREIYLSLDATVMAYHELPLLETLRPDRIADSVEAEDLHLGQSTVHENVKMPRERIFL